MGKIRAKKHRSVKAISLTEQAILQIELMLIAEFNLKRKRLPSARELRAMAEKHHKLHFGGKRFDQ